MGLIRTEEMEIIRTECVCGCRRTRHGDPATRANVGRKRSPPREELTAAQDLTARRTAPDYRESASRAQERLHRTGVIGLGTAIGLRSATRNAWSPLGIWDLLRNERAFGQAGSLISTVREAIFRFWSGRTRIASILTYISRPLCV